MARKTYVWVLTDEKYGPQAVFRTKRAADAAVRSDKYNVSGWGPVPEKFEVRDGA